MSNLANQDKTNDTGVTTPAPTTGTDQPTVVPTDKPVDQPTVTPDPAPETPEVPTPEPVPTTPEPIKEEGEGTPGGTPPSTV